MKKCTQCGQQLSDDTKFCFKCGGSDYEPVEEAGSTDQQPSQPVQSYYAQPSQQPVQPPQPVPSYYTQQPVQPAQQSYNTQPVQPAYQPQPVYQRPVSSSETVSTGMNFLFLFLSFIPIVGLIFAIIVAASSGFKQSYRNLAKAWLIGFVILVILSILLSIAMHAFIQDIIDGIYGGFYSLY